MTVSIWSRSFPKYPKFVVFSIFLYGLYDYGIEIPEKDGIFRYKTIILERS